MINLNMTPGRDNKAIWIIVIGDTLKLSYPRSIVLTGNKDGTPYDFVYDGKAIQKGSLSGLNKNIDFITGNNIGQVGALSFQLSRYVDNPELDGFFNEFYPNAGGKYAAGRIVKVGVVWDNATNESQITWLEQHFIRVYSNTPNLLNIECLELAEVESKMIPPYVIDNQPNDMIHVPNGQTNDVKSAIPIVYGSYPDRNSFYDNLSLVPAILIEQTTNKYVVTCHKCYSITQNKLYTTNDAYDMIIDLRNPISPGFVESNNHLGYRLINSYGFFFATIMIKLLEIGKLNQADSVSLAGDDNSATYATISPLENITIYNGIDEIIGTYNDGTSAILKILVSGTGNGNIEVYLAEYNVANPDLTINQANLGVYGYSNTESIIDVPITINDDGQYRELHKRSFFITNQSPSFVCRIKEIRLVFNNVTLTGITQFKKIFGLRNMDSQRNTTDRLALLRDRRSLGYVDSKVSNVFATCTGMMFSRWIDNINGDERNNGLGEGAAIHNLVYTIESLIRDYILTERNLVADAADSDTGVVKCNGLLSSVDDYYKNAIYINPVTNHSTYITGYNGTTKKFTLAVPDPEMTREEGFGGLNVNFYLTNIQGNEKINYQSFDTIGGPDGIRSAWLCRGYLDSQEKSEDILNKLLFESACILQRTDNKYKLVSLETTASAVDTWTNPIYDRTRSEYVYDFNLSPLDEVYTSFILNYDFDAAKRIYRKQIYVNPNGYSEGSTIIGLTHQMKCKNAEAFFQIRDSKYSYDAKFIADRATAENLLSWLVDNYTCQKPVITWGTDVEQGIKYEIGDQVKLNNSKLIPALLNNNIKFIITSKQIMMLNGASYIVFGLTVPRGL